MPLEQREFIGTPRVLDAELPIKGRPLFAELIDENVRERRFRVSLARARKPPKIVVAEVSKLDGVIILRTRGGRYIATSAYPRLVPLVETAIREATLH